MLPRSNLDNLSKTKRVSTEEAHEAIRFLRQIADTTAAHAAFHTTGRRKVSVAKLVEPLAVNRRAILTSNQRQSAGNSTYELSL